MNLLCFWAVARVATDGRNLPLSDLNGLHKRQPVLAFSLAVGTFAFVGLPPMIGFMGKLFLISATWNTSYNWLVIALVLNSAIAIYYYLSLVRHAYAEDVKIRIPSLPDKSPFASTGAIVLVALALLLGLLPSSVINLAIITGRQLLWMLLYRYE